MLFGAVTVAPSVGWQQCGGVAVAECAGQWLGGAGAHAVRRELFDDPPIGQDREPVAPAFGQADAELATLGSTTMDIPVGAGPFHRLERGSGGFWSSRPSPKPKLTSPTVTTGPREGSRSGGVGPDRRAFAGEHDAMLLVAEIVPDPPCLDGDQCPEEVHVVVCKEALTLDRDRALSTDHEWLSVVVGAGDLPRASFDNCRVAETYQPYMEGYVSRVYGQDLERFFRQTTVVEQDGRMVGVCTRWKAYGKIETVQWLKVQPEREGTGLGRALMSRLLEHAEFPVYLHTQPESFRAVGLYADMGFLLLEGEAFGGRVNHVEQSMPYLKEHMTPQAFRRLTTVEAPASFVQVMAEVQTDDF